MNADRSKFDYSKFPNELSERNTDFVYFAAKQNDNGRSFWDFVLADDKLNEIEEKSKMVRVCSYSR